MFISGLELEEKVLKLSKVRKCYYFIVFEIKIGYKPWDETDLKKLEVKSTSGTNFFLTASNKRSEKMSELKLTGSLKLSLLSGLIEAEGSASYLNSSNNSDEECYVHVHCEMLTKTKSLTQEHHLGKGKITHIKTLVESETIKKATHVVSQVQYGASATFTFKATKSQQKSDINLQGKLAGAANKLIKVLKPTQNVALNYNVTGCNDHDTLNGISRAMYF